MQREIKRIALFGGSFNPIHNGHLFIMQSIINSLCLDKLVIIPAFLPPHKDNILSVEHRLNMLKLAVNDNSKDNIIEISDFEISKKRVVYTYETVKYFREFYDYDKLFLLIGEDSLNNFKKWHRYKDILELIDIVVCSRSCGEEMGFNREGIRFTKVTSGRIDISASMIRKLISSGKMWKYLVPYQVYKYITTNKLYD